MTFHTKCPSCGQEITGSEQHATRTDWCSSCNCASGNINTTQAAIWKRENATNWQGERRRPNFLDICTKAIKYVPFPVTCGFIGIVLLLLFKVYIISSADKQQVGSLALTAVRSPFKAKQAILPAGNKPGGGLGIKPNAASAPANVAAKPLVWPFDESAAKAGQAAWAKSLGKPVVEENSIGMDMVVIPPGTFLMGSPQSEVGRSGVEEQVNVTLTRAFQTSRTEVTQRQWRAVMGSEPWKGQAYAKDGPDYPATHVSWDEAMVYCKVLSAREGVTYRLPTEAEWEWSCRAGSPTAYGFGSSGEKLGHYEWFDKNAWDIGEKYAHIVGQKLPNGFGLSDMHGNVWEWCCDRYVEKSQGGRDPVGASSSWLRVYRGGSWNSTPADCRSAYRNCHDRSFRSYYLGFRLVLVPSGLESATSEPEATLSAKAPAQSKWAHQFNPSSTIKEAAEEYELKVISMAIDPGQLVATHKIALSDGLFLSLSFVVIDSSQPDSRKLNGMAGLAFIENILDVAEYRLSSSSQVTLVRGQREFTLAQPQVNNRKGVVCLDYASFRATDLYGFLQREGKLSVVVGGKRHELSAFWNQHVEDLIKEVQKERERAGYNK
jgi:formylglycine-generating enzyme